MWATAPVRTDRTRALLSVEVTPSVGVTAKTSIKSELFLRVVRSEEVACLVLINRLQQSGSKNPPLKSNGYFARYSHPSQPPRVNFPSLFCLRPLVGGERDRETIVIWQRFRRPCRPTYQHPPSAVLGARSTPQPIGHLRSLSAPPHCAEARAPRLHMGTKSRESIYGSSIRHSAERAREARTEADKLACVAWNQRMLGYKGPAQPSPALGDALNAGYCYLEVRCLGCDTHQTVALNIVRRPKTTPIHELERYMRCKDCSQVWGYPYKRSHLVALRPNKISAIDGPSTWWPGER